MSCVTVPFNRCYRESNRTRARYRILWGGAGSGKSFNIAADFILKLSDVRYRGANLCVVRKVEASNRTSTFAELCAAVKRIFGERSGEFWTVREDPMCLESKVTGARIIFRGMKDASQREKIKSVAFPTGKLTWIWCEEATELCPEDFEILDDRLRGQLGGLTAGGISCISDELYYQITLSFNPVSAKHWIKRRFFDVPPSPDCHITHSTYLDNRFIDRGFARRMEKRRVRDPDGYRVYGEGLWGGGGEGLILSDWAVETLDADMSRYDGVWCAQDFGFNHADCILTVGWRDGELYVLRELYVRALDTTEIIAAAECAGIPKDVPMYCDSAEPDRIRMWRSAGWRAVGVKKEAGSVMAQIDFLRSLKIHIDASCVNTIDEAREWHWMRDTVTGELCDVPCPVHDDAMAALRYSVEPIRRSTGTRINKSMLGL